MRKNTIILTSGLTGSSVLTGLICRAGYWPGDHTHKKRDYDTYENERLIALNRQVLVQADYTGNYLLEYSRRAIDQVAALHGRIDDSAYRAFVMQCEAHRPWLWKDPRLWLTIRFWSRLIDLQACRFILLTRNPLQVWVSAVSRRVIMSYANARTYEKNIERSIREFLDDNGLQYLTVRYEDLIVRPGPMIETLNGHLETALSIEDLKAVYRKPLYKKPRSSSVDHIKAALIYLKNYDQRARMTPGQD